MWVIVANKGSDFRRRAEGAVAESSDDGRASDLSLPTEGVARWLSVAVSLHAALIVFAYIGVVRSSSLQGRILESFSSYLSLLHLAPDGNAAEDATADGTAFFLARGDGEDRAYRLQFLRSSSAADSATASSATASSAMADGDWVTGRVRGTPGGVRWRRHSRYYAFIAGLGGNDQNALAARLVLPLVGDQPAAAAVRVVRLPNVMTNVVQDAEPPPYTAAIVRRGDRLRLARVPQPRLTSAAVP